MTRRERLERKAQKRSEWAEGRKEKASQAYEKSDLSALPLGQPILVGHHSERAHRALIDRAGRAMDKAVEHINMAKHHESKAAGIESALKRSIFSDDPDAIEALEARIESLSKERERNNQINKIIRRKPKAEKTPEKIAELLALGLKESTAEKLFEKDCFGQVGIPSYANQNLGGRIKAAKDRLARIKKVRT